MIFVYQTLMTSQMAVGANTVRPFRLQSHLRYSHNVRRNNSHHCLLLFIREKSKLSRFDIGLSRAPTPTPKFYRRKIAPLFADFTLCRRIEKRCRSTLRYNHVSGNNIAILLFPSAPLGRLAPNEALPHTPTGLCPKNPQGTLSLDPASPLTPGLSLRFISRCARCWGHNFGRLCPFLIPHSSFLIFFTPHTHSCSTIL